jgi:large repetitive protein
MNFLLLALLTIFSACQFKAKEDSSSLVSGHVQTTNHFTVTGPSNDTYTNGDSLSFTLNFPLAVTVTGTPRFVLTIGATTRYATYASGSGSTSLIFTYAVVAADNDTNGIQLGSLDLNGGTLQFTYNGVVDDCDISTVTSTTYSSVLVDNTSATISSISLSNIVGFYHLGETLSFAVTFSEAVTVTGTPRIPLTGFASVTGTPYATYYSGSGTTLLTFRYTIDNTASDTNGYNVGAMDLNGGTINDAANIAATLTLPALGGTTSSLVDFDGRLPYVETITPPANGTYVAAQSLDVEVEFDRAVTVTGSPYIVLTIGSTARNAVYLSGSGTDTLIFRYTTVPGDQDTDGIDVATTITQNSGTIIGTAAPANSFFAVTANNSFSVPSTANVIVNAPQPQATSISITADTTNSVATSAVDNVWIIGQTLEITVAFNDNMYVTQTGGTPRIPITLTSGTVYATYYSGGDGQTSLIFRYTVVDGDLDITSGITLGASIELNGGVIVNAANTNSILTLPASTAPASVSIDGVRPTISSVTPPSNGTYSTVSASPVNNRLDFTFNWSEAVNYTGTVSYGLTVGATARTASYSSGNNTANIVMRYTITAGDTDVDGIATSSPLTGTGSVRDVAGNTATDLTFTTPTTTSIFADTTAPTLSSVTLPANDTYLSGENLDFTVNYNEIVNVDTSGGTPRLTLTIGATTRYATYTSGSGTTALLFRYTIVASELDSDGIAVNSTLGTNGGTIRDVGYNTAPTAMGALATSNIFVDSTLPTITSVTPPSNGTYYAGEMLTLTANFSESVTVAGSPVITVTAMNGSLNFTCANGTGTTSACTHTLASGAYDYDGLSSTTTLSGGSVQDAAGNAATVTFSAPNLSQVLVAHDGLLLWGDIGDSNNRSTTGAVLNTLTDKSENGNTLTTSGSPTYSGNYLYYDGSDDNLTFASNLTNARYIFLAIRTPSVPLSPVTQDLFGDSISLLELNDDTTDIDINLGVNASYSFNCAAEAGPSSGLVDETLTATTVTVIKLSLTAARTMGSGYIGSSDFSGRVGEIMVFDNSAAPSDLDDVCTYLNSKH